MALGVGRVVPELDPDVARLPYSLVGVGFALYGVAMIAYGTMRAREIERALDKGEYALPPDRLLAALTLGGAVLGLATAVLILVD